MKAFAALFEALDASTSTLEKVAALVAYFEQAPAEDAAWATYLLAGGKQRQVVPTVELRALASELAGVPDWLFEESYQAVGDLAETIAYLLPAGVEGEESAHSHGLAHWMTECLLPLRGMDASQRRTALQEQWAQLRSTERFLHTKLIGGGFRVGVSELLVQRAIAQWKGISPSVVAERMMGYTDAKRVPDARSFIAIHDVNTPEEGGSDSKSAVGTPSAPRRDAQPYPFFLAHPLEGSPEALGSVSDWLVEWKYDGIRAQIVKRGGVVHIWSRGEELITERFPEVVAACKAWPDGSVLDGELLVWRDGEDKPRPFAELQPRITRKTVSKAILAKAPVVFLAYDLLELAHADQRALPQSTRRSELEVFCAGHAVRMSPSVLASGWDELTQLRAQSRSRGVEGFMLKQADTRYGTGRSKATGQWFKWKIEPMLADGVLIYAQAGHGRRASLYTDYTFAAWSREPANAEEAQAVIDAIAQRKPAEPGALQLLPFAKAYSGLSDAEFSQVDALIRKTTLEKFGPVRAVRPSLVIELAFEGIQASTRHKSGIALRFPRMARLRFDKPLHEAATVQDLAALAAVALPNGAEESDAEGSAAVDAGPEPLPGD